MKQKSLKFWITTGVLVFFAVIVILDSFYTVKSTERGVLSTSGKSTTTWWRMVCM